MNKNIGRLVVGAALLLFGLLLGWMARGLAGYNTAMETVVTYQDWRTACPPAAQAKELPCEMIQDILDDKSHQTVARISITREKNKQVMGFTMPFGVALQPGIGLQIGKDPVKVYPYRTCNSVGCIVVTDADDKLVGALTKGPTARVLFAGLDGKPVAVPLSLKGFNEAHHAYLSAEAKRGSWFWRLWS